MWLILSDMIKAVHLSFLCPASQNVNANPRPTAQDLAGFWDLLQLSIEDISMKFDELYQLKANNWQLPEKPEKKVMLGARHHWKPYCALYSAQWLCLNYLIYYVINRGFMELYPVFRPQSRKQLQYHNYCVHSLASAVQWVWSASDLQCNHFVKCLLKEKENFLNFALTQKHAMENTSSYTQLLCVSWRRSPNRK